MLNVYGFILVVNIAADVPLSPLPTNEANEPFKIFSLNIFLLRGVIAS